MRRILFEIPLPFLKSIPIYSYGFMLMVAFVTAIIIARWRAKKEGIDPNKVTDLGIYLVCAGIFGARLFFIIQYFDDYRHNLLNVFKIYEGGLVYYGGLFAGIITLFIFVKKHHLPFLKLFDILMPSDLNLLNVFKIYEGGLVYYGGLFAGIITLFIFVKKHHLPFLKLFDILMPSAALGLGLGRIGCFLNGCCFGKVAQHIPWALQFPRTLD